MKNTELNINYRYGLNRFKSQGLKKSIEPDLNKLSCKVVNCPSIIKNSPQAQTNKK